VSPFSLLEHQDTERIKQDSMILGTVSNPPFEPSLQQTVTSVPQHHEEADDDDDANDRPQDTTETTEIYSTSLHVEPG
jgi:hypothetical protein